MAVVSRSRSRDVPSALLLLLLLLAVASAAAVGVAAKTNVHDVAEESDKEEESWTGWAKEKISEGLGLKHHADVVDEEEAARKAGHTVKSARESAQNTASGKKSTPPTILSLVRVPMIVLTPATSMLQR
jgi:hypothetical protein